MKFRTLPLQLLALLGLLVAASTAHAIELKDDLGRVSQWPSPPQRIVSVVPSLTEMVCELGACGRLVGVDRYSNFPAAVNKLPKVGGMEDTNVEMIAALKPEVVLVAPSSRVAERLESLGIKVVVLKTNSYGDVQRVLGKVGELLGSSIANAGWLHRMGLTGAAFTGCLAGVGLTLLLARGAEHTLRLLLAGVIVGVVLMAATNLVMLTNADILREMQAFMFGSTGLLGWSNFALMASALVFGLGVAVGGSRTLDALMLGEATAQSLGVRLGLTRAVLIIAFAVATGTAVAQAGLIAFVGLVAPHLVRHLCPTTHSRLLLLSACTGGALLLAADILARGLLAPQELPVGIVTAILGGVYLLVLMHRRTRRTAS